MVLHHTHPVAVDLCAAIQTGDLASLRRLAEAHVLSSVLIVDRHGTHKTLLHVATDWPGHFPRVDEVLAFLIASGVPMDSPAYKRGTPDGARETALHWAASSDDVVAIEVLVAAGANVEAPGAVLTNGTPLADAVVFQKWAAARCLLGHGAQVTPWQAAALNLKEPLVDALPALDPRSLNVCLWHACRSGHEDLCRVLVEAGANAHWVGPKDWTPIRAAQDSGNERLVAWLSAGPRHGDCDA